MRLLPPQCSSSNCFAVRATCEQGILRLLRLLVNLLAEEIILLLHCEEMLTELYYRLSSRILRWRRALAAEP